MKSYRIAIVPGDGIGHEILPVAVALLEKIGQRFGFSLSLDYYPWGAGYYLEHEKFISEEGMAQLEGYDAILFGAVGLPEVDDRLPFRLFTNFVRTRFKQYVNYRPVKLFAGLESPLRNKSQSDIDFVIIRENNEGEFVQSGRTLYGEWPEGLAIDTNIFTRQGITRIARYAFDLATHRRGKLTNVTKSNTLIHTLGFWDQVIEEVAGEFPEVEYHKMYVDAASANFVLRPEVFDVILTTNMIGDILSDLGGAIMGSLGLGGSGNINPEGTFPSMFEPIHGSAPDIAGRGWANPIGQCWSAALMLSHLGETDAAEALERAIEAVTTGPLRTRDLGGSAGTEEVGEVLLNALDDV